jgi:hypothetical protein
MAPSSAPLGAQQVVTNGDLGTYIDFHLTAETVTLSLWALQAWRSVEHEKREPGARRLGLDQSDQDR